MGISIKVIQQDIQIKVKLVHFPVLDLKDKDENQLLKEMEYQTRRNIKKTIEIGVKVEDLSY